MAFRALTDRCPPGRTTQQALCHPFASLRLARNTDVPEREARRERSGRGPPSHPETR